MALTPSATLFVVERALDGLPMAIRGLHECLLPCFLSYEGHLVQVLGLIVGVQVAFGDALARRLPDRSSLLLLHADPVLTS